MEKLAEYTPSVGEVVKVDSIDVVVTFDKPNPQIIPSLPHIEKNITSHRDENYLT